MGYVQVECLRCGETHTLRPAGYRHLDGGECPRCTYVGWATSEDVTEVTRKALRERPLERRRLRIA
jgi:phage FluMu protein Com